MLEQVQGGKGIYPTQGYIQGILAFHGSGAAGKIENDKGRGETYIDTTTVARVNLDDVEKPKLHVVDRDVAEDRKLNQGAMKTRFMKLLLAAH